MNEYGVNTLLSVLMFVTCAGFVLVLYCAVKLVGQVEELRKKLNSVEKDVLNFRQALRDEHRRASEERYIDTARLTDVVNERVDMLAEALGFRMHDEKPAAKRYALKGDCK